MHVLMEVEECAFICPIENGRFSIWHSRVKSDLSVLEKKGRIF